MDRAPELRIGTSGWQYDHWRGDFYPADLAKARWFAWYAERFDCVEVNNTFYQLPAAETFDAWREQAPAGFLFALKLSRFATHMKRLKDPEEPLERFFSRATRLGAHLGPVLAQLPPRFAPDPARLARFLAAAPRDVRIAVEFRDDRWLVREVYDVLRESGAALCIHDHVVRHPRVLTTDWTYLRYHGAATYDQGYTSQRLVAEAARVRQHLAAGRDVYAFFNNDIGGHAPRDAGTLRRHAAVSRPPRSRTGPPAPGRSSSSRPGG